MCITFVFVNIRGGVQIKGLFHRPGQVLLLKLEFKLKLFELKIKNNINNNNIKQPINYLKQVIIL